MDSNLTIKPRSTAHRSYASRDPVPVREAIETDLDPLKPAAAPGDRGTQRDPRDDHPPHDPIVDPESREVINRANDVGTQSTGAHPDKALLRQRAYRPACASVETPPTLEVHANIKA